MSRRELRRKSAGCVVKEECECRITLRLLDQHGPRNRKGIGAVLDRGDDGHLKVVTVFEQVDVSFRQWVANAASAAKFVLPGKQKIW